MGSEDFLKLCIILCTWVNGVTYKICKSFVMLWLDTYYEITQGRGGVDLVWLRTSMMVMFEQIVLLM